MSPDPSVVVDLWAGIAAATASAALGLRANMLKRQYSSWCSAPFPVVLALVLASACHAGVVLRLIGGRAHASPHEALVYTGTAAAAVVLLVNLARQAPGREPRPE